MGSKIVGLSFKNSPEDIELYNWIICHSGVSAFIKDVLRSVKSNEVSKKDERVEKSGLSELISMDF